MARCPTCPYQCGSVAEMVRHAVFCQSRIDRAKRIKREKAAARRAKKKEQK